MLTTSSCFSCFPPVDFWAMLFFKFDLYCGLERKVYHYHKKKNDSTGYRFFHPGLRKPIQIDFTSRYFRRVYRFWVLLFLTPIAKAFRVPTMTTSFFPLVTAV